MPVTLLVIVPVVASVWVLVLLIAPIAPAALSGPVYLLGSHICHQIAERSFHLDGAQLPVCARCFGIYVGATAGLLAVAAGPLAVTTDRSRNPPYSRRPGSVAASITPPRTRLTLIVAAVPTALTLATEWAGFSPLSNAIRATAGVWLGAGVAFAVMAAIHYEQWQRRRRVVSPPSTLI